LPVDGPNAVPPRNFSPFEPVYLRHFRVTPNGRVKWYVEIEQPWDFVGGGISETHDRAREAAERAVARHLRQIASDD
jgi:hypothetical protein